MADGFKLGIALPVTDDRTPTQFWISFTVMEKPGNYEFLVPKFYPDNSYDSRAAVRNALVLQAIDNGCSHLIMMDTDQIYPVNTLQKLLAHGVDVVAAKVHRRWPPFDPIMYRGELFKYKHIPQEEWKNKEGLFEIDATGTGCILYDMEVFKNVEYPWYEILTKSDGSVVGEDICFCSKLRNAGYKIFMDTSVKVGHLSTMVITESFYEWYTMANNARQNNFQQSK